VVTAAKLPSPSPLCGRDDPSPSSCPSCLKSSHPRRARAGEATPAPPSCSATTPGFNPRLACGGEATTSTGSMAALSSKRDCFNPRLARAGEATRGVIKPPRSRHRFNPRLARAGEATAVTHFAPVESTSFNPRLARAGEATTLRLAEAALLEVSIRASPVRARRQWQRPLPSPAPPFQSAPRPCGRGDAHCNPQSPIHSRFNPRLARAGEATVPGDHHQQLALVSIRASPVRARRLLRCAWTQSAGPFQSAPRPCGRGDQFAQHADPYLSMFQSAPRPCGRGDGTSVVPPANRRRFQSAPRPCGRGDNSSTMVRHGTQGVSIRASPVRARRPLANFLRGHLDAFQSAPRPCGRGDRGWLVPDLAEVSFNPRLARAGEATQLQLDSRGIKKVSIRASPVRARRQKKRMGNERDAGVSIRASPVRARRHAAHRQPHLVIQRFNPRLARAGEATGDDRSPAWRWIVSIRASPVRARRPQGADRMLSMSDVSIRASPVRARRLSQARIPAATALFQSAPRPCGRGDYRDSNHPTPPTCFNPRLARAGEATVRDLTLDGSALFQSAPRPCGRGDKIDPETTGEATLFQSAPRPCGRGDSVAVDTNTIATRFQSAPRPCGRGDVQNKRRGKPKTVSIRASPVRARRQQLHHEQPDWRPGFNPRLARAGEAT